MATESERILTLEINQQQMAKDLTDIKTEVKEINVKFDLLIEKLEKKFVMRTEFKVAIWVISALATVVWLIIYFTK